MLIISRGIHVALGMVKNLHVILASHKPRRCIFVGVCQCVCACVFVCVCVCVCVCGVCVVR